MQVKEMFKKPIDRDIKGVIKVGQNDEENQYQELNEYVVTSELLKHFREFFSNYNRALNTNTDDIGVWISGFFGSGKSHFLKILSYILDSNMVVKGRRPIDFFKEDEKIDDPMILADMSSATNVSTEVILFNIDSKSSTSSSESTKILDVFVKVFNEFRGYCSEYAFIADFEKNLEKNGRYDEFKQAFEEIEDESWENSRDDFYFIRDSVIEALVKIGYMSEEAANNWADKAEDNYNISIEKFADEINDYCNSKGPNHKLVFLVDEVGQYIGDSTPLMLNLQSLTEDLGIKCRGNAWIIVTSQQNIDEIISVKGQDFSKIQGRFKTRLSLSSANVDEVIRKRILTKTDSSFYDLENYYVGVEPVIKNLITFKDSAEMKTYISGSDFASIYPFIPYQFNLLQSVLTSIREHGASGKHLAEGERSMLALFQESAIKMKDAEMGALVPFDIFYDALEKFVDHSHSGVIIKAYKNDRLNYFDVRVLKTLFLIKYVKEIKGNVENIATLMVSNIRDDKIDLKNKIEKSLRKLLTETLIQKNGEIYSFLTNEEQDLNREIKNENVEVGEILDDAGNFIFQKLLTDRKIKHSNRYNFSFNKIIDDKLVGKQTNDIGIRIITPYYENDISTGQMSLDGDDLDTNMEYHLKQLSNDKNEAIFYLGSDLTVFEEITEILQIRKYLQKNNATIKPELKTVKQAEYSDKVSRSEVLLEEALKNADVYIKGQKIDILEKNSNERVNEAMGLLIKHVFSKLGYFKDFAPEKSDILKVIKGETQQTLSDTSVRNAEEDLYNYVKLKSDIHEKISIKDLLNKFSSAPYGYTDLDIEWLIAKLFSQNSISLIKNNENITLNKYNAEKILDFLTKTEFRDKILVKEKADTPINQIKSAKSVYKELFDTTNAPDNDEELMDSFKSKLNDLVSEISNDLLVEYNILDSYPGKNILIEAEQFFKSILAINTIESFYRTVSDEEDEILDLADDINPVLNFFKGPQKEFYKDATSLYKNYEVNKNLINSIELERIANEISNILNMPYPYSHIQFLDNFIKQFKTENKRILELEKEPVRNDINNIRNSVDGDKEQFNQLLLKLENSTSIPEIRLMTQEAENIREKIIEKNKPKDIEEQDSKPVPAVKDVSIVSIMSKSRIDIKSEEDINMFVEILKENLKREINDYDEVRLSLR
ncbi:MAG: BREX system P-loop protein BrxC [Methanobrevibacter sp.]|uniref:BREX system P-loop protein BrxC n=1 Tax=Methanobrevibacter sp. TaxID=66852 RepID=UPI0026DEF82C|nr:BREX system P-loop protein BrxC [Methanobrevibacter sp.]MDO5849538.1 BREX system P-loop protein BrxC [Methanobrevibacter sp.]